MKRSPKILSLQKNAYDYPPKYEYDTLIKVLYEPCQDEIDAASGIITKGSFIGFRSNGEVTILPKPTRNAKKLEIPDNIHIDVPLKKLDKKWVSFFAKKEWKSTIKEAYEKMPYKHRLKYLVGAGDIHFPHVGRDGSGTKEDTCKQDPVIHSFLLLVASQVGCLIPKTITHFIVKPGWFAVRKLFTLPNTEYIPFPFTDSRNRDLWPHQLEALSKMSGRRHFIRMPVGFGKSNLVLTWLSRNPTPKNIVWTCPKSAIPTIQSEIEAWGALDRISIIEHDRLKKMEIDLANTFLVVDEVHKTMNDTQRTSKILEMAGGCDGFIAMTGTPMIDNKIYKLVRWIRMCVNYEVTEHNFWIGMTRSIGIIEKNDVEAKYETIRLEPPDEYWELVPKKFGGTALRLDDFRKVYEMCAQVVSNYLASITEPCMIIADSISDRHRIAEKTQFLEYDNYIPKSGGVVVHKKQSAGYRLIHLDKQYTGVYFSNQADREQLQGRIVVYGMQKKVTYYTVVCGITQWMHANHLHANSISQVIKMIK